MSRSKEYDATGIEHFSIPNFTFISGEKLDIQVAYRCFNRSATRTAILPTCYGGRINTTLNFSSGALSGWRIIVVAMLGNGESSSPSNTPNFPKAIDYQDCINSQAILLTEHFKSTTLDAVIGFSMGGQQAYYWAVMHSLPSSRVSKVKLKSIITICSSAHTSGHNYTFLEGPIGALETSFDYDHGRYRANGTHAAQGLRAFGRAYAAWLTSPEWFRQELWRDLGAASLRDWIHPPPGASGFESWDPEDLLLLARMWQAGDVGVCLSGGDGVKAAAAAAGGGDDYKKALEGVLCRVLVMPARTDQYFRWEASEVEVECLKRGRLEVIETIWGHIAGGGANPVDVKWMDGRIKEFLNEKDEGASAKL